MVRHVAAALLGLVTGVPAALGDAPGRPAEPADPAAPAEPAAPIDAPGSTIEIVGVRLARPASEVPAVVTVLTRAEIERSPKTSADDLVRTVPSAATFRRSSSLVADPSSQGANLRGVGPSGVSRSLVLLDGIPENDPFGGWVYWRALPLASIDQVEIQPSGASASFGNLALGGVIQLRTRPIRARALEASLAAGGLGTTRGSLRVSERLGRVAVALDLDAMESEGYAPIAPADRGAVDGRAGSEHASGGARAVVDLGSGVELRGSARGFAQDLDAGTRHTSAAVRRGGGSLGVARRRAGGTLHAEAFGGGGRFDQDRARVGEGRATAERAARQRVPSSYQGASVRFETAPWRGFGRHTALVGIDALRVAGTSREQLSPPGDDGGATVGRQAGGEQRSIGLFAEDAVEVGGGLALSLAIRLDGWQDRGGRVEVARRDGGLAATHFAARDRAQLSPRLGVLQRLGEAVRLRASGYRAFRAPTLNELYRPFQVGTVLTDANAGLAPETLWGAEAGPEVALGGATLRATAFWNRLDRPIHNVTLAEPSASGATRQRRNLGRARVRGVELALDLQLGRRVVGSLGYTFVDPVVVAAPGHPELIGKLLAQDPRQRASATLTFDDPAIAMATGAVRFVGRQFEDDLNTLPMASFALVDLAVARRLPGGLTAFATAENLLDRRYLVGRAGIDTVGQPRTVMVGARFAVE